MSQFGAGPGGPTPPGWYPDQWGQNRWWDGARWTDHVSPAPTASVFEPPAPPRSRTGLVVGLVVGGVVLALGAGAVAVGLARSSPSPSAVGTTASATPTASAAPTSSATTTTVTPVTAADQGTVVFSDDFTQQGSGWTTKKLASGTTFTYGAKGYVVVAKGDLHHYAYAPYDKPIRQLAASGTFVTAARVDESGAGVTCDARAGARSVFFEFLVLPGGHWFVEEGHGAIGAGSTSDILKQGTAPVKPGATMTVTGSCATAAEGSPTVLTMFIDGRQTATITSTTPLPSGSRGWQSDLLVASYGTTPTTVVATTFVLRDTGA